MSVQPFSVKPTVRRRPALHRRPRLRRPALRGRRAHLALVLALAFAAAACAPGGDLTPPPADVAGIQTVAVFPPANDTAQAGLEDEFVARLVTGLQTVGWYEVVPMEDVTERLSLRRPSTLWNMDDDAWLELAREIALDLGADGFIAGRVAGYEESVTTGAPYATAGGEGEAPEWRAVQTTRVTVTLEARLVNAHTGEVIHERRVAGVGVVDDARLLNWSLSSEPPTALIPSPHRRDVAAARERAVDDAFAAFAEPLLPQADPEPADATAGAPGGRDGDAVDGGETDAES